jgi:hypothetical protein
MNSNHKKWLIIIFIVVLAIRLFLAFSTPNFTYESYFHLRQIDQITQTGLPLYEDPLSYGGRTLRFLPGFHYLMAVFATIIPLPIVVKILPNLLIGTLPFIVYLLSKQVSKSEGDGPLLSAFIAGFLPILFETNAVTPNALFLPLIFLTIYAFMNLNKKVYVNVYILTFLLLSLTSSFTFLLIIGFGIYLLLSLLEGKKINTGELELIIFSVFFFVWTQFLFFKETFINEGTSFIWQNIPIDIITQYFPQFSVGEAILLVSVIPFIIGIYVVYKSLFRLKNERAFLLISFAISTTALVWLRLVKFETSLAFFGLILAILFGIFYREFKKYLERTKFTSIRPYVSTVFAVALFLTMIFPALNIANAQQTPADVDIEVFKWVAENADPGVGVLALLEEGHLVTYYANRKNLMDDQFVVVQDVEERFEAINGLFRTSFETHALKLLHKYELDYVVLTDQAKRRYNISTFPYKTGKCFDRLYRNESKVYKVKCVLEETNQDG